MPSEIHSEDEFKEIANRATRCIVKHTKNEKVKVKLRTRKRLYTYVTDAENAEKLIKGVKAEIEQL
jgi:hypothetical protein